MTTMRAIALLCSVVTSVLCHQPGAPTAYEAPLRELPWGQLNFLHTTDTHGWHAGHLQEPSFSADWGDYISFAKHMRDKADKEGVDLLLVDTGDRIEGNGLYDSSDPKGKYTFDIFKHQEIDVICSGNHELYKANSSFNEFYITVPNYQESYLASNIDIYIKDSDGYEALAPRYKKFTTKNQGIRITAFGFLYDFKQAANNARVLPVSETIKQSWFQDAVRDKDTDLFLVTGHVAIRSQEFDMIFKAIRDVHWDVPILFLGGHTHIRDYKIYDKKAAAVESGRYMETIGFAAVSGLSTSKASADVKRSKPKFGRRYIDNNLYSFHQHTSLDEKSFPTELGKNVSRQIAEARSAMKLDKEYGCAPKTFWVNRAEFSSDESVFTWLGKQVIPDSLASSSESSSPKMVISNTGAIRFDVFEGPFTHDSAFLVCPFTSGFRRIKNVDFQIASRLLDVLNSQDNIFENLNPPYNSLSSASPPQSELVPSIQLPEQRPLHLAQSPLLEEPDLRPGYTTKDDGGDDGDDTIHAPIQFYRVPNCIQSDVDFSKDGKPETVDIVYNEFIQPWILLALNFLGLGYEQKDTTSFMDGVSLTDVITGWVEENWPCEDDESHTV